jgi:hypothetical protein
VPAGSGLTAAVQDDVLAITAGRRPTVVPVGYTVMNARGLSASGVVTVTITPDAAAVPPTASDVFVDESMESADGRTAVVDLTRHVTNPGGMPDDLILDLPTADPAGARKTGDRQVTVTVTGSRQVIAYRVANTDKLTATAFIVVRARDALRANSGAQPEPFRPRTSPLEVQAGTTVTVDVPLHVTGAARGRAVTVPADAAVSASTGNVRRLDAQQLRWTIPADAPPHGFLRVQVTDGQDAAVTVSIPATIRPVEPPAPTFQSTVLQVAAGGTATVELAGLVTPGGPGQQLTYGGPTGVGHGVIAVLSGSTLTVSADVTAPRDTRVDLGVSVSDRVHPAVPATVRVTVVASTAPLARVPDAAVAGVQGTAVAVDVLAGASNPLPGSGPLRVVGARVVSGIGTVRYAAGGTVTVTPGAGQLGPLRVQVLVQDATGDPDRTVTGRITVTVAGPPDRVTGVAVADKGDGWVALKWRAPADNGKAIEYYLVRAAGYQHRCAAGPTQCRLPGLTNDVGYRFTVTAHNHVGDSPPSAASTEVRPDVAPAPPRAATLTAGDRSITVNWRPPADRGSAVRGYLVTISPAPISGSATVAVADGTTHTFKHLVNGTSYQVTVVAQNRSGTDSDASAPATAVPAGRPARPAAPALTYDQGRQAVVISWVAPDGNGDDDLGYTVSWNGDNHTSGVWTVPPGDQLSRLISRATLGVKYAATVTASNRAGSSPASDPGRVRAWIQVAAPADLSAAPTGADHQVTVRWTPPPYSGWDIRGYDYQLDDGDWKPVQDVTRAGAGLTASITDDALTNGQSHRIAVRACTVQGPDICGSAAVVDSVVAYGPIGTPTLTGAVSGSSITFHWTFPADGNGRPVESATVTIAGAQVDAGAGHWTGDVGWGASRTAVASFCVSGPHQCSIVPLDEQTGYPSGTIGWYGAPTFASLSYLVPDDTIPGGTSVQVACWDPRHLIGTDGHDGWFQIATGRYGGKWTAVNNFNSWRELRALVPQCG